MRLEISSARFSLARSFSASFRSYSCRISSALASCSAALAAAFAALRSAIVSLLRMAPSFGVSHPPDSSMFFM